MKKSLIVTLALVFVLGIVGTAFAATNPFVDVPAKHWAYGSISQLANAGIIDGYGDGTFRGDQLMTRYEMAQIVAKAMAKSDKADAASKATIDKLAVEFAAELNNLGVRVSKLEANASSIKFSGDARLRYVDTGATGDAQKFSQRFRLNMTSNVNDNTSFYGRFMVLNHNEMGTYNTAVNDTQLDRFNVTDAAFTTKNFLGTSLTVGRFSQVMGQTTYFMNTVGGVDGAKIVAGNKVKVTAGFANFKPYAVYNGVATAPGTAGVIEDAYFGDVSFNFSKATKANFSMIKETSGSDSDYDVKMVGLTAKFAKNFALVADYGKNYAAAGDPKFYIVDLTYGAAKPAVAGSWSLTGEYRYFDLNANPGVYTGAWIPVANVKGWSVIGSYTLAKNIVMDAMTTFNGKVVSTGADANDYTRVQINYMF